MVIRPWKETCRLSEPLILIFAFCPLQCGTLEEGGVGGNLTERSLQDAQRLFLMNDVVQPLTVNPLLTQDNLRFSKMVVDIVQGKDNLYHVMYISTGKQGGRALGQSLKKKNGISFQIKSKKQFF